jgi:Xaa-Pro aminopeptidase
MENINEKKNSTCSVSISFVVYGIVFICRYELGLGIRETCLNNCKPGTTLKDVGEKVEQYLLKKGYDPNERRFRGKIRYGDYNHSIGMATHDPISQGLPRTVAKIEAFMKKNNLKEKLYEKVLYFIRFIIPLFF